MVFNYTAIYLITSILPNLSWLFIKFICVHLSKQTKYATQPVRPKTNADYNLSVCKRCYLSNLFTFLSMITNFERETHELNGYELNKLLPIIVQGLSTKIGKEKAITNKAICKAMQSQGYKLNDARLRKVIHHIRAHDLIPYLIATSKGYYIATNGQEVEDYIKSLSERINSIQFVKQSLERQFQNKDIK